MAPEIFITHSHKDRDLIDRFMVFLQIGANLSPREIRCTAQLATALAAGTRIADELRRDLKRAGIFIPVITVNTAGSEWVGFEIGAAWAREEQMLPVKAGRAPTPALLAGVLIQDFGDTDGLVQYGQDLAKRLWWARDVPSAETTTAAARVFADWYQQSKYFPRRRRQLRRPRSRSEGSKPPFEVNRHGALVQAWAKKTRAPNPSDVGDRNFKRFLYDHGLQGGVRYRLKWDRDGVLVYR